ncbi:bifunctional DNA primase/polymerase [Corynebacterium epidermidicanis]|uniref:Bifunctional DNA primase/polymerase famiily protein n=1 Tax=Corynebacterium epidermidicanis TaxID=1050174 RepID=A0A0G3GMG1_9CORY|nr:bifunctional DNA primase/polymerase [Corynebacterium epidermidicanis]AKK02329.1 bifunctional DNA primase/polymerase famiily protein [Corynebacterium epidermidicanis]
MTNLPINNSEMCMWAVELASQGFEVFPLHPRGTIGHDGEPKEKTPIYFGGHNNASSSCDLAQEIWTDHPNANIGIRVPEGHCVIDIDPRHGGFETFSQILGDNPFPETLTTLTGSEGLHLWFNLPDDRSTRGNNAAPGIDIKTRTGYVVAPGSWHPNGNRYQWERFMEVAMLPDYLEDLVYKPRRPRGHFRRETSWTWGDRNADGLIRCVAEAPDGNRNNILFWAACVAYEDGLRILYQLEDAALSAGLELYEIERTINSAARKIMGAQWNH